MDPVVPKIPKMDVPQHLHGYLEAQKGNMRDSQFRSLQKLCSFLDDSQNQRGSVHQLRVMLRNLVSDNELLSDWVLNILGAYVVHRSSEPNTLQILLTLFKVLLSIQDKLISDRVRRVMGYMIKLWEKLVHDESASDTLVEYLDFVECEMLVEQTMSNSVTTASLGEGSESGENSDTSENSNPTTAGVQSAQGLENRGDEIESRKRPNAATGQLPAGGTEPQHLDPIDSYSDDITVAPPVPQLTAVFLVKEARKWVNRVILACHKDVREAGKRLICTVVKLSSGPGCILTPDQVKEVQPLRIFRNIFSHILSLDPLERLHRTVETQALGDGAETVLECLHYCVLKSAKYTDQKIYEQFLQDITDLWCNVTVILRMCLNKAFNMVKFPSEARTDVTKANIDHVENTLTCALELSQPISKRPHFVDDYALHQCIMKCCLKFGVFQSSMKKEEAQRYDILFSGLIKLCVHSVSTPILKEIYEISSSHQDIVMHFIYHFFVHESLLNVMPQTAQLTSNLILPMIRAGGLAEKTIDSFFGWLDPNKDNDIYLKKTRLSNLVHLLTSIKGDEEFSDNLCKKLAIWEAMRGQIFKISAQSKHLPGSINDISQADVHHKISDFDRRMRRVATERAALAQSQLLEMLDNEEREMKVKERKAKRNKRTKARRKKKKIVKAQKSSSPKSESPTLPKISSPPPNVQSQISAPHTTSAPRHFPPVQRTPTPPKPTITHPAKPSPNTQQRSRNDTKTKMCSKKRANISSSPKPCNPRVEKPRRKVTNTVQKTTSKTAPSRSTSSRAPHKRAESKFPRAFEKIDAGNVDSTQQYTPPRIVVQSIKPTKTATKVVKPWSRPIPKKATRAWGTPGTVLRKKGGVYPKARPQVASSPPTSAPFGASQTSPLSKAISPMRNCTATTPPPSNVRDNLSPPSANSSIETQESSGTSIYDSSSVGVHLRGFDLQRQPPPRHELNIMDSLSPERVNSRSLFAPGPILPNQPNRRPLGLNLNTTNNGPEIPEVNPWNCTSSKRAPENVQSLFPSALPLGTLPREDERQRDIEQNLNKLIGFGSGPNIPPGPRSQIRDVFPLNTQAKSFEPKINGFEAKPRNMDVISMVQRITTADKLPPHESEDLGNQLSKAAFKLEGLLQEIYKAQKKLMYM